MPHARKRILCYVTDRRALGDASGLGGVLRRAAQAGVDWIQVREQDLDARALAELVRLALEAARETSTRILVNDRLDVALATGAAGVHLGEKSLPGETIAAWRRTANRFDFVIGASCHSPEAARIAEHSGADYVYFGPVFSTPSKAAFGPPQGIERLQEACSAVRIPVYAIGGITAENAAACLAAGAAGIAAIRLFQQSVDLAATVASLRGGREIQSQAAPNS